MSRHQALNAIGVVHKITNVLSFTLNGMQSKVKNELREVWLTESQNAAKKAFDDML